ncbi:MAG TPA: lysophospholipid acyltransferase family protein [Chloroflexota bacterium]|jgi:1-acyl-sn-glycerol-3-phosphate acyltransferase
MSSDVSVELTSESTGTRARLSPLRQVVRAVLGVYMRLYHRLELRGREHLPARGPAIVLVNHASLLDVPALMVLDPYPDTIFIAKASLFKVPLVGWLLGQWDAIAVERQGRDSTGVRMLLKALHSGRVLAVAAEGRRTRSGRLGPINPVLAKIAASSDLPLVAVGISGSFEALPPGAKLPRPHKLLVRVGDQFRIARGTDAAEAARRIQAEIAALLPLHQQPLAEDDAALADDDVDG